MDVHDPWVDADEAKQEYGLDVVESPAAGTYDAIILAVGHRQFRDMGVESIRELGKPEHVLYDVKYVLPASESDGRI